MRSFFSLAALFLLATSAAAATSPWVLSQHARSRLIGPAVGVDGALYAGIEIALEPGWKTYWRSPGEAGQAPEVRIGATRAALLFPVPKRYEIFGIETIGYQGSVILPLRLARDAGRGPLDVDLRFAICKEVCIPMSARHRLPIDPADVRDSAPLLAALRAVPVDGPAPRGFTAALSATGVALAGLPAGSLFVEGPEGLLLAGEVPSSGRVQLSGNPTGIKGLKGKWIVLTLVAPDRRAISWRARL